MPERTKRRRYKQKSKERENELMKDRTNQTVRRLYGLQPRHRQASFKPMEQALSGCPNSIKKRGCMVLVRMERSEYHVPSKVILNLQYAIFPAASVAVYCISTNVSVAIVNPDWRLAITLVTPTLSVNVGAVQVICFWGLRDVSENDAGQFWIDGGVTSEI